MALVTVTNVGDALQKPDGTVASNSVIEFRTVSGDDKQPIEGWTSSGEVTQQVVRAVTGSNGVFSVSLWPTTLMAGNVLYLVRSLDNLFRPFYASLVDSAGVTFTELRASQIPLTQADLDALQVHLQSGAHLPLGGVTGAVLAKNSSANFDVKWQTSQPGSGDMTVAVYDSNSDGTVNHADLADAVPWSGITGKPSIFPADSSLYDASGAASTVQSHLDTHTGNTSNPHSVTKAQVGLGNVSNTAQEPALGNPSVNGYVLSSTTSGTRSWVAPPSGASIDIGASYPSSPILNHLFINTTLTA